jgi:hypothetical protein
MRHQLEAQDSGSEIRTPRKKIRENAQGAEREIVRAKTTDEQKTPPEMEITKNLNP